MLISGIKFFTIFYLAHYTCIKLFPHNSKTFISKYFICISTIIVTILALFIATTFPEAVYLISLILIWVHMSITTDKPKISFLLTTFSYFLNFCIHAVCSILVLLISYILFEHLFSYTILSILSSAFQILFITALLKNKRLKKGVIFSLSETTINVVTLLLLIFFSFLIYFYTLQKYNLNLLAVILTLAFLIYWWQAQITKAYRRNLELRELESMRTEMAELKKQMEELKAENDRLARITHRDNTLISALKNSTVKYLSTDFANPAVAEEVRNQLIENINTLSAERASLMTAHKEVSAREFATGLSLLDTLLHEMDEKALEMKITFAVHMGISLNEFIPNVVLESDLVHTVDDLLKNAFKATRSSEKRVVQLQFYKLGKNLVIEVADSGIPFEVKSLVNMGVEKLTTYEDGSGIGLMDIWNTKESYGATYHLEECVNAAPFTKKISLTFDKKNRYSIRTLRKEEILQASRRADLQVYDFSE